MPDSVPAPASPDSNSADSASADSISAARDKLLQDRTCQGMDFCRAYTAVIDDYLAELFWQAVKAKGSRLEVTGKDIALVALGGYGRGEMCPHSDLDIQLIYGNDYRADIEGVAKELWYPLWNDKLKLGHSVGSYNDITLLARHELNTATTLLSLRHVAGDPKLTQRLRNKALRIWYSRAAHWLDELLADAQSRHNQFGSVAYTLEPNLKQGAGGLRDTQLMCWGLAGMLRQPPFGAEGSADGAGEGESANASSPDYSLGSGIFADDPEIREAYQLLLSTRVELHRVADKAEDRLLFPFQDDLAEATGYGDARELMSAVAQSARLLSWRFTELAIHFKTREPRFSRLVSKLFKPGRSEEAGAALEWTLVAGERDDDWSRQNIQVADLPVKPSGHGMVGSAGDNGSADSAGDNGAVATSEIEGHSSLVRLHPDADIDQLAMLRLAVAAAERNALIDRPSLTRLNHGAPVMPEPWPELARELFVRLLLTGRPAIAVIEALDIAGLFTRLVPEWKPCSCLPQQNVYHQFTVDRHLCEAAAEATKLIDRVARPDLLVVGAFFHDIGKGYPGDHTEVGIPMIGEIATRMGYGGDDAATLQLLVREHLLLPDIATRRDLSDASVIAGVADKVGTVETLQLLAALTEADSIATSSMAWSGWKKNLLFELLRRTEQYLTDGSTEASEESVPTSQHQALMAAGESMINGSGHTMTVISPDHAGQFSEVAGVLALNNLYIREGIGHVENDMALCHFLVEPAFAGDISWDRIEQQVAAALAGRLALAARLAAMSLPQAATTGEPMIAENYVKFDNDSSQTHTVIEIGAPDCHGLLRHLSAALTQMRLGIFSVKAQTLGGSVVDSFYVQNSSGEKIDTEHQGEISKAIEHAVQQCQAR